MAVIGIGGTVLLGSLGLTMLSFGSFCEPILRAALPLIASHVGGHYRYDPSWYYVWAWAPMAYAALWFLLFVRAWLREPAIDRRIDIALRSQVQQSARGAPIEPD
jgi:hypothetical protein